MIRNATAILLVAALAMTASAANLEIPQKALAQEARTRAAFTSAERTRVATLEARLSTKMSVNDVTGMTGGDTAGVMFVVMMDYLKLLQKEAREDRKLARTDAKASVAAKEGKMEQEKTKIEAMKQEAGERFERAMQAANLEMMMGIASSSAAAASTGASMQSNPTSARAGVTPASKAGSRIPPLPSPSPSPKRR